MAMRASSPIEDGRADGLFIHDRVSMQSLRLDPRLKKLSEIARCTQCENEKQVDEERIDRPVISI
ncbi:MAG: hypothetical protein IT389_11490 [Nitrospira sp.]|nr:hypothetical protein [Nitrospira sp.]